MVAKTLSTQMARDEGFLMDLSQPRADFVCLEQTASNPGKTKSPKIHGLCVKYETKKWPKPAFVTFNDMVCRKINSKGIKRPCAPSQVCNAVVICCVYCWETRSYPSLLFASTHTHTKCAPLAPPQKVDPSAG
mmetsp:Transcript_23547/g.39950  ORF Transcript_23547/g.39950 Transcript_23547/m.39950 type:complete len:133 (+) Transcript_23547:131-529(+)